MDKEGKAAVYVVATESGSQGSAVTPNPKP